MAFDDNSKDKARMAGRLYIVATPIGNLADLTARSTDILKTVPIIACEDTRRTGALLAHVGASRGQLIALHDHNEAGASARLIGSLQAGLDVALVTDAGTPLVSDPGFELVRAAWQSGISVTPIPGCSAITVALAASPIPVNRFRFEGFLPTKGVARQRVLDRLLGADVAVVFFEAPHRMRNTLTDLVEVGAQGRSLLVCRELTKRFETLSFGTVSGILADTPILDRGEFTCILAPATVSDRAALAAGGPPDTVIRVLAAELPPAQAARLAAKITGRPRAELYETAVQLAASG